RPVPMGCRSEFSSWASAIRTCDCSRCRNGFGTRSGSGGRGAGQAGVAIMEFDNSFEVPLPADDAWKVLMDIRRIVPCMPGAALTEVVDDRTSKAKPGARLGPVALSFAGTVKFEEIDAANHRAR